MHLVGHGVEVALADTLRHLAAAEGCTTLRFQAGSRTLRFSVAGARTVVFWQHEVLALAADAVGRAAWNAAVDECVAEMERDREGSRARRVELLRALLAAT